MIGPTHIETGVDVMRCRKKDLTSHHTRLLSIQEGRSLLNNSVPRSQKMGITKSRLKSKTFYTIETINDMQRTNNDLLNKLTNIDNRKSPYGNRASAGPTSLNTTARKEELYKINQENQRLAKMLSTRSSAYSRNELETQAESQIKYRRQISKVKLIHNRLKLPPLEELPSRTGSITVMNRRPANSPLLSPTQKQKFKARHASVPKSRMSKNSKKLRDQKSEPRRLKKATPQLRKMKESDPIDESVEMILNTQDVTQGTSTVDSLLSISVQTCQSPEKNESEKSLS